jgi:hypothetical protein
MYRSVTIFLLVVSAVTLPVQAQGENNHPPSGFRAIFDGKSLAGWWGMATEDPRPLFTMGKDALSEKIAASLPDIQSHWSVADGELINDGHGLFLTTLENYGDFELWVDYKTVAQADSGIYLRGIPQVQIWDTREEGGKWNIGADKGSGGLWNNSPGARGKNPRVLADKPFGEWNRFHIVMIGDLVSVTLNDELLVDRARLENYFDRGQPVPMRGPVQLQTHGGEIRWRNVFLREIGSEEANAFLREQDSKRFEPIFNGRNFDGWRGPTDNYEVLPGGVLRCRESQGGTIFTEARYADFQVEFDVKFPPGGNNGLAIRYPGQGDAAYAGMCELQVLENTSDKFAGLDARQFHGSAYGMVPAHRGFQRKVGEWNHQRVTVKGSSLRVELNGFAILDCDLNDVSEFMANSPHPGKGVSEGHFGFAGHNDPVEFRNIRLRELEAPSDALHAQPWTELFDGESLEGWEQKNGTATYRVENGSIVGRTTKGSPNSFLCSKTEFADFELEFIVKVDDHLNSGMQIRSISSEEFFSGRVHGPQVEIEASPGEAGHVYSEGTGRGWLSPKAHLEDAAKRVAYRNGLWNHYRVLAQGPHIQTWINGLPVGDVTDSESSPKGFLGLQVHSIGENQGPFEVRWANIRIRER